jgi:hypothetical protein
MIRSNAQNAGRLARLVLEQMARDLGVSYDDSMFECPASDAALVMDALRCGVNLIIGFTYPDGWSDTSSADVVSKKFCKKAAKQIQSAFQTDDGRDAITSVAQGYAQAMAEFWRRAATQDKYQESEAKLLLSAERSEALGELIAHALPVQDFHGVLGHIRSAEEQRFYDPNNPDALTDLHDYAEQARVTSEALALAAGAEYEDFAIATIGPVMSFRMKYSAERQVDWTLVSEYWVNLLLPNPISYGEMNDIIVSRHGG